MQSPPHPTPREPFGAPRARVPSGRTLAYIHVVTEGGVGAVLQPALVAHVVEDARGHQGVVQHLPGRGVIQAQPPAPAERERSQRHHHRPRTLLQPLTEELNSSLMSHRDEKQLGFPADRTPALQPPQSRCSARVGTCRYLLFGVGARSQSDRPAAPGHGGLRGWRRGKGSSGFSVQLPGQCLAPSPFPPRDAPLPVTESQKCHFPWE